MLLNAQEAFDELTLSCFYYPNILEEWSKFLTFAPFSLIPLQSLVTALPPISETLPKPSKLTV